MSGDDAKEQHRRITDATEDLLSRIIPACRQLEVAKTPLLGTLSINLKLLGINMRYDSTLFRH